MILKATTTFHKRPMNSNLLSIVLYNFFFWAKNRWQLKLGWCKKEDQLREILFCVWIWLTDRDRRWYTFSASFVILLLFFLNLVVSLFFAFVFSLSLTVTKFMHYFNKGCFRGTLIQWWKCFLNFFLFNSAVIYRFVCFFKSPPAAYRVPGKLMHGT